MVCALSPFFVRLFRHSRLSFGLLIYRDIPTPCSPSAHSNLYVLFVLLFHFDSKAVVFLHHLILHQVQTNLNEISASLGRHSYAFVEFYNTRDAEDAYYDRYVFFSLSPVFSHLIPFHFMDACLRVHALAYR